MSEEQVDHDDVPRAAKRFVALAFALLLVPGLVGFEAWPLTAWRLFSLSRDDDQTKWVLETVDDDGAVEDLSLEDLPLRYRTAEWPMAELPGASASRRDAVCSALLDAAADARPGTVGLRILRDRQRLEEQGGEWVTLHDETVEHQCALGEQP